ncbi:MAG: hypothetical protein ABI851_11720 [Saprospiraceae bacterium]
MTRITLLFSLLIMCSCKQNTSALKENILKYENGNIKRRFYTSNEMIQDTMWDYYPSGELSKLRLFKDSKQDGRSLYYFKEGPLSEVQHYINGSMVDMDTTYFISGKIRMIAEFKNNMRNGAFTVFKEDGSIEKVSEYRNDTLLVSTLTDSTSHK